MFFSQISLNTYTYGAYVTRSYFYFAGTGNSVDNGGPMFIRGPWSDEDCGGHQVAHDELPTEEPDSEEECGCCGEVYHGFLPQDVATHLRTGSGWGELMHEPYCSEALLTHDLSSSNHKQDHVLPVASVAPQIVIPKFWQHSKVFDPFYRLHSAHAFVYWRASCLRGANIAAFDIIIIPEQFTVKAQPALFEGEGRGGEGRRGETKKEAL